MINLRESHNQYQKLSLLFVTLLGIVMTFISVPASGYSEAWGGCLIPVGTETATGPVISMVKLQDNKQELIVAWKGLFLLDNKLKQVAIVDHEIIGEITAIQKLPGIDEVLIGAINGVFLYDAASRKVNMVDGGGTEPVILMHSLPDGKGVLIGTWDGLFLFDIELKKVVRLEWEKPGAVVWMYDLPGRNGVLISTWREVFLFDPESKKVVMASDTETGKAGETFALPKSDQVLIGAQNGLFISEGKRVKVVPGVIINSVNAIHDLPGSSEILIAAKSGIYLFNKELSITKLADGNTGSVYDTQDLTDGKGVIIAAEKGFYLFDKALGKVVPVEGETPDHVFVMHDLPGANGILIGAKNGLYRFDIASKKIVSVGDVSTGTVDQMHDLPGNDGLLIGSANGWFWLDMVSLKVIPAGGARTGPVFALDTAPESDVALIGAQNGLYTIPSLPLSKADVQFIQKDSFLKDMAQEVELRILHPCASQIEELGLRLSLLHDKAEPNKKEWVEINRVKSTKMTTEFADVSSIVTFKEEGNWQLQLSQAGTTIGNTIQIPVKGKTLIEYLMSIWPQLVVVTVAIYVILFLVLLVLSHYSLSVFGVLSDPAWGAKLLTCPFFLLRHVPAVQCWVLEPWFQNVRRKLLAAEPSPFLDSLVQNNKREMLASSALLGELNSLKRVWLQGGIGMGKTAIFKAWARAYYCDPENTTLSNVVRQYGFLLVMVPVRDYAMIKPPDSAHPESWVVEVISRRFMQFGLPLGDVSLLTAMLRAGHIAIGLDGTNEADCKEAINSFERQFPQVKIIATSQSVVPENWSSWTLPKTIAKQRVELLTIWFRNSETGKALDKRLASESNVEIVSGYDLRLLFELMESDPYGTPIPEGRIGLYCAILSRATRGDGEPLDLSPLRQLAVKMVIDKRRSFTFEEGDVLGDDVADILSKDSPKVIRKVHNKWEFRHDQMRAFLAACSLADDSPTMKILICRIEESKMFRLMRDDQEALWGFLAGVLSDTDLRTLWIYAQNEPEERALLQSALQRIADKRKIQLSRPVAD